MSRWGDSRMERAGRIDVSALFYLSLGIILVFLIVAVSTQSTRLDLLNAAAMKQQGQSTILAARVARSELAVRWRELREEPVLLHQLAEMIGSRRIMVWRSDGQLLLDSLRAGDPADGPQEEPGITPLSPVEVRALGEAGRLMPIERHQRGGQTQTFWLPIPSLGDQSGRPGLLAVIMPVAGDLSVAPNEGKSWTLRLVAGAALLMLAYFLFRSLRGRSVERGAAAGARARGGDGRHEFVMGTFEGLIHELKGKEQELASLRREAEERARNVESHNDNILRSVASGVLTVDRGLRITSFNEAAERILGLPRAEAIGKSPGQLFGEEDPLTGMIRQTLQRGEWLSRQELELDRPHGRVWVGMSTSLLHDKQGTVLGATVVFTDLTEIRQLQEQVELRRRLASLGEMSAGIAHEFRNYMGTIMGYARLVAKRLPPDDPTATMADAITEELKSMNRLIDDLLNFGRRAELALQPTNLTELIRHCAAKVEPRGTEQRVAIRLDLPPGSAILPLDTALMRQSLLNLLNNAVDAMPDGGTLTVAMRPRGERNIEITVQDTGVGISPDNLEKIFLPMFTTKQKGTGLGLALAHKIVLSHGGRITAESREGSGTTFRIVLPVASVPLPAVP